MTDSITISRNDVESLMRTAQSLEASGGILRNKARNIRDTLYTLGIIDADNNITTLDSVSSATNGIEY